MIELDGRYGEGGGQIVRTALALSTLTGLPFSVENIRKGRCDSGLKAQHLYCVKALEDFSGARAEGASLGSEKLVFFPGKTTARTFSVDVGTAGSLTLLLQSLLAPVMFAPGKVRIRLTGGTDVPWSQPYDYFCNVLVPQLSKFCKKIDVSLDKRGYFPKGGGKMQVEIVPSATFGSDSFNQLPKISLVERGELAVIRGVSHASSDLQKAEVAERQASAARSALARFNCPVKIDAQYSDSLSTGSGICLWAVFANSKGEVDNANPVILGADSLGERRKRAEDVGREAAVFLSREIDSGAPVDRFLADQLLPFMALSGGEIKVSEVTPHCLTNIYVIEKFLGNIFEVDLANKKISVFMPYKQALE